MGRTFHASRRLALSLLAGICATGVSLAQPAPAAMAGRSDTSRAAGHLVERAEGAPAARRGSDIIRGREVRRTSLAVTATYDVDAHLLWADARLRVRTVLHVTNRSGGPIDRLELNTIAGPLGDMNLQEATVDGDRVSARVSGQTIHVPLGGTLPDGARANVMIRYAARLRSSTSGLGWAFAKANGMVTAYRWIPWISRERPFRNIHVGDPYFTTVSPRVEVAITTDRPLQLVTNGRRAGTNGLTQRFVAQDVRDLNFTAAPSFSRTTGRSFDGETSIAVYTRTATLAQRQSMLAQARRALRAFERQLGEYPYPRFVISEAPGDTALESPGMMWIGGRAIDGVNRSYLVVHETAHQWFYGVVGNDQPREPFADEAVTDFLTRWYRDQFRDSRCARNRLDGSVYDYGTGTCLFEVVYVQGANFLNEIRQDIGSGRFWGGLRAYYRDHRFGQGSTFELLEVLRRRAQNAGVNLLPRYRDRFPSLY